MKKNFSPNLPSSSFSLENVYIHAPDDLSKRWYIYHYFDVDERGKPKRKRVYGKLNQIESYEERMEVAHKMRQHLVDTYEPPIYDRNRMWEFVEAQRGRWKRNTWDEYTSKLGIFCEELTTKDLSKDRVSKFFDALAIRVSRTTYNNYLRVLKTIATGIGEGEHFEHLKKLNADPTPAKYFQKPQRVRLRDFLRIKDPELYFHCQCVYYLFLRPIAELRLMKCSDFDLERSRVRVRPEISKNGKHQYVAIPNSFKSDLVKYLRQFGPSDWIFPGVFDKSKPIGENTLSGRHRKILKELGFGHEYKLYSWKHTGAIACVEANVHPKILQLQLRHSTLEMTDRYLRQLGVEDLGPIERLFPAL